ncbi:MAG: hypothetical protein KDD75_14695 [Caldilineaceae bacterium]|nr:hypothetical protein [Caldilineaceae bacterium]
MFRKILGIGLIVLLLSGIFGGFGSRTRAAYYEGYSDGLQAQTAESAEESAPPAAPYRDGYGHGGFMGWAAFGVLGFFAIFFKIGFFFLLAMMAMRLIFGRRRWHRGGPWGRGPHGHGPWGHHHKHERPGREKSPKWMEDSDDDEPVMTV